MDRLQREGETMSVLVTGAAGFIGMHVTLALLAAFTAWTAVSRV